MGNFSENLFRFDCGGLARSYFIAALLAFFCAGTLAGAPDGAGNTAGTSTGTAGMAGPFRDIESRPDGEKINYYTAMGDRYLDKNDYISAIESYNEAIAIKEKNPGVLLKLGETYRRADMREEAVNSYMRALKYKCDDAKLFLGMGLILKSELLYEKAEIYFRKALEESKDNPAAVSALAEIYSEEGRYEEAIKMYKQLLNEKNPDGVKDSIAGLYVLSGDYAGAGKYFTPSPVSSVLRSYAGSGNSVAAESGADETFIRGISAMRKGNTAYAKKCFEALAGMKEDSLARKLAAALSDGQRQEN